MGLLKILSIVTGIIALHYVSRQPAVAAAPASPEVDRRYDTEDLLFDLDE